MMMNTRWYSLKRRLLVLLLGGLTVVWLGAVVLSYLDIRHEIHVLLEEEGQDITEAQDAHERHHDGRLGRAIRDKDFRHDLIEHLAWQLLLPILFGLPLLGGWVWLVLQKALAPLNSIAEDLEQRSPNQLQPIVAKSAPQEIQPLLMALNRLFARVDSAMENERQFTADAAHEMRTPLAALSAQLQVAQRASDNSEKDRALDQALVGVKRVTYVLSQLLTLARLESTPADALPDDQVAWLRLDKLVQEVCAEQGMAALEKNITLEAQTPRIEIKANHAALHILLSNLVDNAIRYTPAGGRVLCRATQEVCKTVRLEVIDNGPGIPAHLRARACERFSRLVGQEIDGCGLGLSIVQRCAKILGAKFMLCDSANGSGLTAQLELPQ